MLSSGRAKKAVLDWCQLITKDYKGVNVENLFESFQDGLAVCAIIHKHNSSLIKYETLTSSNPKQNFDIAIEASKKESIEVGFDFGDVKDEKLLYNFISELFKKI